MVKPAWHLAALVLLAGIVAGGCETSSTVTTVATAPDTPKCQVAVSTPPLVAAEGGSSTFSITTEPECAWTASTSATWISAIAPANGQGNGNVAFRVAANDGAAARDGAGGGAEGAAAAVDGGAVRWTASARVARHARITQSSFRTS